MLIAASVAVASRSDDERACERERTALHAEVVRDRDRGPEIRQQFIDRIQDVRSRYAGKAPACVGRLYEHEVFLYILDHRYRELVDIVERYLEGEGRGTTPRTKVVLNMQRGWAREELGEIREAARAYYRAASLADRAPAEYGVRALNRAGRIARILGEQGEAEAYLNAAITLADDSLQTNPNLRDLKGITLTTLALLTEARLEGSALTAEQDSLNRLLENQTTAALEVLSASGQAAGFRALALSSQARMLARTGQIEEAREQLRDAAELARRAGPLLPRSILKVISTRAFVEESAGRTDTAREIYQQARAEAARLRALENEANTLQTLGRLEEREGHWAVARDYYLEAIDLNETQRDRLGLEDWRSSAFTTMLRPYRGLVRTQLLEGDVVGAFQTLDQTRARYLRDLLRSQAVRRSLRPDTRDQIDSVTEALAQTRLDYLQTDSPSERAALRLQTSAYQQQIERLTTADTTGVDGSQILDLPALRQRLGTEGRTLVAYFIDDTRSTAFVLRPDTLVAIDLETTGGQIRTALESIGWPWARGDADPAFQLAPLHALYQQLVEPVRPWVPTRRVTIIPDLEVATVPFAALLTDPTDGYESAPYLLYEWTISSELAASLIATSARTETVSAGAGTIDVVAFGKSDFGGERFTWNKDGLRALPNVAEEIAAVAASGSSRTYLNDDATEGRFYQETNDARIIHLASHAEATSSLPMYSRIFLESGGDHDGTLYLYELLDIELDADLVVLSGCSTADGERRDGEGLIGLQYGVRGAGASATVATLWPVADEATAELMGGFYESLADGQPKDEALRAAQLAYLESHEGLRASPFYWAAPVLSGDPAPIPFEPSVPWGPLGAIAVVVVGGGLAWRFRSKPAHV